MKNYSKLICIDFNFFHQSHWTYVWISQVLKYTDRTPPPQDQKKKKIILGTEFNCI